MSADQFNFDRYLRMSVRLYLPFVLSAISFAQWQRVSVPTASSLRGLSAVTNNVVWASGTGGTVIRTVDGGQSWSVMIVPGADKLDLRGIRAFDENNAVLISSGPAEKGQARIYRTSDGGKTWNQALEEKRAGIFFDAIAFWDRDHGIVLSDPVEGKFALFTTSDGGATWKQIAPASLPAALPNEGAFAASNSCLAVQGDKNVWFGTGGASVARVFRSPDRGQTWTVSDTPMHPTNNSSGIFSLRFKGFKDGIAVGGDYAHADSSPVPNSLYSSDRGRSWKSGNSLPGIYLSSVAWFWSPGKDSLAAVGIGGLWIAEGGGPWVKENDANLNSVAATAGRSPIIWAVGAKGLVLRNQVHYDHGHRH
jgi:photosystem II stability/assembly factor-like uncharacterized protein